MCHWPTKYHEHNLWKSCLPLASPYFSWFYIVCNTQEIDKPNSDIYLVNIKSSAVILNSSYWWLLFRRNIQFLLKLHYVFTVFYSISLAHFGNLSDNSEWYFIMGNCVRLGVLYFLLVRLYRNFAIPQNFHTRKLGEILVINALRKAGKDMQSYNLQKNCWKYKFLICNSVINLQ